MTGNLRKRMQKAVGTYRALESGLSDRRPSDLLMLESAIAVVHAAEDLASGVVGGNKRAADAIVASVRATIGDQVRRGMQCDASALGQISDPVSRLICERQVHVAEQVHLLAAVALGVEAGLRDAVAASANRIRAAEDAARAKDPAQRRTRQPKAESPALRVVASIEAPDFRLAASTEEKAAQAELPVQAGTKGNSSEVTADSTDL